MVLDAEIYAVLCAIAMGIFFIIISMIPKPEKGWIHR